MIIATRLETPEDEPFVRRLVTEMVAEQLGAAAWPEAMRHHLLNMQYTARRAGTASQFPHARSAIVLAGGEAVGWLVTADLPGELRIIDILIDAARRGEGIGSRLIEETLAAAKAAGKPVRLSVHSDNFPALRLYERLGFRRIAADTMQIEMEARPL